MGDIMTPAVEEKKAPTLDQVRRYVKSAKDNKVSDEEIYQFLEKKGALDQYKRLATENGVDEKEQRKFIGRELDIDTRKKPTLLQNSLQMVSGALPIIGEKLGVSSLQELKSLPGAFVAGAVSAPRSLIDLPTGLIQASTEFHYPGIEQPKSAAQTRFGEFLPETAYVPTGEAEGGPSEVGDIGPLLRALLPSAGQTTEQLVAESSMPKTGAGEAAFRAAQFAGGGAAGGPAGALVGGGLGLVDYSLEQQGFSPEARAIIESLVGALPASKAAAARPAGQPPPPPTALNQWKRALTNKSKSKVIDGVSDLAAKVLVRDPDNINFQTIRDLQSAGFDLSEVPVQAYTKGGLPNWLEGAQENAIWGHKRYNQVMRQFTKGMTERADTILDSFPIEQINEAVTHESLGAPVFDNYVKNTLNDLAPNLNIDRPSIGSLGKKTIEKMDVGLRNQATGLYEQAKFTDVDALVPDSQAYKSLERTVAKTKRNLSGEGFIGKDREMALNVINQIEQLFAEKEIGGAPGLLGPTGEPLKGTKTKPLIKYEDLRKNLQALNQTLNYEQPSVVNLLEPISTEIREIFRKESVDNPKLIPFLQAQEVFSRRARLLNDPRIRKLYKMNDEQFFNAMRKPSNMEAFRNLADEIGAQAAYDQLRGGIIAKELAPAFEATTPNEMASKLSNSVIERVRDIERFYPEYPEFANGLKRAKENAYQFDSPEAVQKGKIRQEAIDYQLSGDTPSHTLAIMNNPKGIDLVKDALSGTEQGKSIYNSLARKKLEQTIYGKTRKTELKLGDLADVFKDKEADAVVKRLLPEKNYNELKTLSRIAESFEEGKAVSPYMKKQFEKMILTAGGVATYLTGGLIGGVGTLSLSALSRAALTKGFRKSIAKQAKGIYKP